MQGIKTFIFDLDGTLLMMDTDHFMKLYFTEMGKHFKGQIEPQTLMNGILKATHLTVMNTEKRTNETVFWEAFGQVMPEHLTVFKERIEAYYHDGYQKTSQATKQNQDMIEAVKVLKDKGYEVIIATNPLFPQTAIHDRIQWAGFKPHDFKYITSFENNHYCKPQLAFYEEVLMHNDLKAHQCFMVGNDVQEDLIIKALGVKTWLLEECVINRTQEPPVTDYQGSSAAFLAFVKQL